MTGCRQPGSPKVHITRLSADSSASRTPTHLASQIADANFVIVTNPTPMTELERGFSLTISGNKARDVVQAISSAQRYDTGSTPVGTLWLWQLHFYRDTNCEASVYFEGSTFIGDGGFLYRDEGGTLDKLYREVMRRTSPPEDR
jgi:hypothetical protein